MSLIMSVCSFSSSVLLMLRLGMADLYVISQSCLGFYFVWLILRACIFDSYN